MTLFDRFRKDEQGSMAIELCIVTPILVWVLISTIVYFDLFRTEASVTRASLTIADLFSRELDPVSDEYIDGAVTLLEELTFADDTPLMRITSYSYDSTSGTYQTIWSETRGLEPAINDAALAALDAAGRLPMLADGARSVLLETSTDYVPILSTNLSLFNMPYIDDQVFNTFTVIRPRFGTKRLCFDDDIDDATNAIIC